MYYCDFRRISLTQLSNLENKKFADQINQLLGVKLICHINKEGHLNS